VWCFGKEREMGSVGGREVGGGIICSQLLRTCVGWLVRHGAQPIPGSYAVDKQAMCPVVLAPRTSASATATCSSLFVRPLAR
jgi:hypothetical protein